MMQTNAYREEQNFSIDPVSNNNPFKMHGEIFDKQGYRMDVTIWFRHKNEVFYYVDNEGELHGPMDKKHSINLAGVHKLGHGYNYHQESSRNAYESSNRPVSANLDGLLTDLDRLRKTNAERTYKASYSQEQTHKNTGHMSKWSSWTNNQFSQSPNRYATTVTRQHVKTTPQTVEVVVKRPPSLGASRIDITDNSRPFYRSSSTQIIQNESMSNREKMLIDELLETKRELQNIKRSQSQIGMQTPPVGRANGSQYFNEMWTTRSLRKAEGPPNWKMQTSPRPIRTVSQTNLLSQPTRIPNNWTSETNIRTNNLKTGYSAHRENTNNAALLNEIHNRESYNARNAVDGKYYEELEVITLQPIGKGVQDLQSGTFTSTLPRSAGFRSGQHSPSISNFNRQKFTYESSTNDIRSKTATGKNYMSPQISISNAGHVNAGNMGIGGVAGQISEAELGIRSVIDTQNIWYRPDSSRDEVISMLRDEEPGSFIIRKSSTFPNSYGLALKVHKIINRMNDRADDRDPELVRHFLIEGVEGGVHLRGFAEESVYKSLSHFVHHHTIQRDALPCCLRLMHNGRAVSVGANSNLIQRTNNNFTMARSGSVGSRDFHQNHVIRPNGQIDYLDRNRRIKFELAYLGSAVVDKLNGDRAARKATTDILSQFESDGLPKKCIVSVEAIPGEGIHIQEYSRRINLKKFIKSSDVEWIGFDPEYRKFHDKRLTGISESGIIALILKKHRIILTENSALLFAELNPSMSSSIIDYIRMNFG